MIRLALAVAAVLSGSFVSAASINDLTEWTEFADPADPGMTTTPPGPNAATLLASGAIPSGTDIGYASVNGPDVVGSTQGYAFDPGSDFSIAIDYTLTLVDLLGAGGIGFGIGEDVDGTDSAGVGLGFGNLGIGGDVLLYGSAGRVNDVDQPEAIFSTTPSTTGRFFVEYDSATGDVTVGISTTPGAASPTETVVMSALQDQWDDEALMVSFFLRSQSATVSGVSVAAMSDGDATAVFSNFEVLSGSSLSVPEPTATLLATLAAALGLGRRRST